MSKLDEAFLKAYAKDRPGPTRLQSAVAPVSSPVASPASSVGDASQPVLVFDGAHSLDGPHYPSVSVNLSALDMFAAAPAANEAPPVGEMDDAPESGQSDILLSEPTARIAPEPAPPEPQGASRGFPTPEPTHGAVSPAAETFQAVWEVDRFDFEETICELSGLESPLREAGRQLKSACREGLKVLAVTSPLREQGRSTLAVVLARMVAATGASVMLVDGDLQRPSLADKLRLEVGRGWDEAIRIGLPAEEVAVQSVEDGFTVLPLLAPQVADAPHPPALATAAMLDQLRASFDLVIIDTGTLNIFGGWVPGAEQPCRIDAAMVIQDARGDDLNAQQACLRKLTRFGIENIGIVENFVD